MKYTIMPNMSMSFRSNAYNRSTGVCGVIVAVIIKYPNTYTYTVLRHFFTFIHQRRYNTVKTVKSRTVSTGQKGSKSTYICPKRYVNEETHCTKTKHQNNDTCIEFRRDIKALTLLTDTTSSGNLFHSWTTRTEKQFQ